MMSILSVIFWVFVTAVVINYIKEQFMIYGNMDLKSPVQTPALLEKNNRISGKTGI